MITPTEYIVSVHKLAQQGKANKASISSLAEYFHLKPSQVIIVSGETSRKKVFEMPLKEDQLPKPNQTELKF
jgi:uncharacterized protein YggU (UPF0235/DUF167 family)